MSVETPVEVVVERHIREAIGVHDEFREMAKVVTIDAIVPIKKADKLELAQIGGWSVIVGKGMYEVGQKVIYCEIDALLPMNNPLFSFLAERHDNLRQLESGVYYRLKTIRMRGELSQGLVVPIPEGIDDIETQTALKLGVLKYVTQQEVAKREGIDAILESKDRAGLSWAVRLGIWIAGKAIPSQMLPFPDFLAKSEQSRVQNISGAYGHAVMDGELFERTLKVDGSSATIYTIQGMDEAGPRINYGVTQRNYEVDLRDIHLSREQAVRRFLAGLIFSNRYMFKLGLPELRDPKVMAVQPEWVKNPLPGIGQALKRALYKLIHIRPTVSINIPKYTRVIRATDNPYAKFALQTGILDTLVRHAHLYGEFLTVQGELAGPGIDDNAEGLTEQRFMVFSVYRDGRQELLPEEARAKVEQLGLEYIPVVSASTTLPTSIKDAVKAAEGPGHFDPERVREGDVYKSLSRLFSFKVISAGYLLAEAAADEAE